MKSIARLLLSLSNVIERVTIFILQLSVAALLISLLLSVLFRYVLKSSLVGTNEIAHFLLAWITFLGASLSIKKQSMVAVNFLVERTGKYHKFVQATIQLLILLFSVLLLVNCMKWMSTPGNMTTVSSELQLPIWIPFLIIPISLIITVIFNIENIIKLFVDSKPANDLETNYANEQETEML